MFRLYAILFDKSQQLILNTLDFSFPLFNSTVIFHLHISFSGFQSSFSQSQYVTICHITMSTQPRLTRIILSFSCGCFVSNSNSLCSPHTRPLLFLPNQIHFPFIPAISVVAQPSFSLGSHPSPHPIQYSLVQANQMGSPRNLNLELKVTRSESDPSS